MPDYWPRIHRPAEAEDEQEIRQLREVIARSLEILRRCEPPDTFLGRRTQEPFPMRGAEQRRG
jgi:hypothetical protein